MAFNIDHSTSGDILICGNHIGQTGTVIFPKTALLEANILTAYKFDCYAISGLSEALDSKLNTSSAGTALFANIGIECGNIPPIVVGDKLPESTIPTSIINDFFVVNDFSEVVLLSEARQGDFVTVTNDEETYVLNGQFSNSGDWAMLSDPGNLVTSLCVSNVYYSGDVCVSASGVRLAGDVLTQLFTGFDSNFNSGSTPLGLPINGMPLVFCDSWNQNCLYMWGNIVCEQINGQNCFWVFTESPQPTVVPPSVDPTNWTGFTGGWASSFTLDSAIKSLDASLISTGNLCVDYVKKCDLTYYLDASGVTITGFDCKLTGTNGELGCSGGYLYGQYFSGEILNYTPTSSNSDLLQDYVLRSTTGNVAEKYAVQYYCCDLGTDTYEALNDKLCYNSGNSFLDTGIAGGLSDYLVLAVNDDGVVDPRLIPAYALNCVVDNVGQGEKGDMRVSIPLGLSYILTGNNNSATGDWVPLSTCCYLTFVNGTSSFYNFACFGASKVLVLNSAMLYRESGITGAVSSCGCTNVQQAENPNGFLNSLTKLATLVGYETYFLECVEPSGIFYNTITSGWFIENRSGYTFCDQWNAKSNTGHSHQTCELICAVLDFDPGDLSAFGYSGNNECYFEALTTKINPFSITSGCSAFLEGESLILGTGNLGLGSGVLYDGNYAITKAAGKFCQFGDNILIENVCTTQTTDDNWTSLATIPVEINTSALVFGEIASRSSDVNKTAAFKLVTTVKNESGVASKVGEEIKCKYYSCGNLYNFRVSESTDSISIDVKGDASTAMNWIGNFNTLKVYSEQTERPTYTGTYFFAGSDSDWFNLKNWFADLYWISARSAGASAPSASTIPNQSRTGYVYGNHAATINLDNPSWATPALIDINNVNSEIGLCLVSTGNKSFWGRISGSGAKQVYLCGVTLIDDALLTELHYNGVNRNWYDLNNWFYDAQFSAQSAALPDSTSTVYMHGATGACINLNNPSWVQPLAIDISDVSGNPALWIYSSTGYTFTGSIVSGSNQILLTNVTFN